MPDHTSHALTSQTKAALDGSHRNIQELRDFRHTSLLELMKDQHLSLGMRELLESELYLTARLTHLGAPIGQHEPGFKLCLAQTDHPPHPRLAALSHDDPTRNAVDPGAKARRIPQSVKTLEHDLHHIVGGILWIHPRTAEAIAPLKHCRHPDIEQLTHGSWALFSSGYHQCNLGMRVRHHQEQSPLVVCWIIISPQRVRNPDSSIQPSMHSPLDTETGPREFTLIDIVETELNRSQIHTCCGIRSELKPTRLE
jgi:hypothetical protein